MENNGHDAHSWRDSFELVNADSLHWLNDQPTNSVDFVIGSPPYALKGERYQGGSKKWPVEDWVEFMFDVTVQACRIARRQVVWVMNGAVRGGEYHPAVELLIADVYRRGARIHCERPVIWHKNAPPNRRDWLGNDWEFCPSFFEFEAERVFNWEAIAEPPKFTSGGAFRQRTKTGERRVGSNYPTNKLARPRDVWRVIVGGGVMGHELAHENEAPFPLDLAARFIMLCTNPGDVVLDPFLGSGTSLHAAFVLGRRGIGVDCRRSQLSLTRRRLEDVSKTGLTAEA